MPFAFVCSHPSTFPASTPELSRARQLLCAAPSRGSRPSELRLSGVGAGRALTGRLLGRCSLQIVSGPPHTQGACVCRRLLHLPEKRSPCCCGEVCAALPSAALPPGAPGRDELGVISAGAGAEHSALKLAAQGAVVAGRISAHPGDLVRLEQGKAPLCFPSFAACSALARAVNDLLPLSLSVALQRHVHGTSPAPSSEIPASIRRA